MEKNFTTDIMNEMVNNVTRESRRDVDSHNNDDSLSTEKCICKF